ncbi:Lrp/AsnC family transcriptional regulator [Corynebacterium sp.]|jgi:Lrp/AsnC family transcriptional regulator for asnA, asnC and gidA|uniref:Lrp/AsnC family transcriptional regulator n=1 Tax=Corynebacterium sp. TaxID=1720 RepID=UPI0025C3A0BB|nr:Lrp/AsnC family transcriptional regulator [Corynebacterium sp.]
MTELDPTSKQIIELLQQDGRRSYADIARSVGLSEGAARQRVSRLIDSGVMQIVAVTDPGQLGFLRQAMIGVRTTGPVSPVADALAELSAASYVVVTAGVYDLLVEVVCADDRELLDLVDTIRATPGVRETETMTYLDIRNETYNWGTR